MARQTKYVGPLRLDADDYRRLEEAARTEERDPLQQARWLIKRSLGDVTSPAPAAPRSEPAHAA